MDDKMPDDNFVSGLHLCGFKSSGTKWRFGSDQSVWRDGDWNGFGRIALAGLLISMCDKCHTVPFA